MIKKFLTGVALVFLLGSCAPTYDAGGSSGKCWVNGYTRKDGTHVSGYYRSC